MKRIFYKKLTIDDLKKFNITDCTESGEIYIAGQKVEPSKTPSGYRGKYYYSINIILKDENGKTIKKPGKQKYVKASGETVYYKVQTDKSITLGVHRLVYLWNKNKEDPTFTELPAGSHVDHIDNVVENNSYKNLQLLTPAQNLAKDRKPSTYKVKMPYKKVYTEDYLLEKISACEAEIEYYKEIRTDDNYKIIHKKLHSAYAKLAVWKNKFDQFIGKK